MAGLVLLFIPIMWIFLSPFFNNNAMHTERTKDCGFAASMDICSADIHRRLDNPAGCPQLHNPNNHSLFILFWHKNLGF
jgi:hypothetical protein